MNPENPFQQCKNCGEEHRNLNTNLCTECAAQVEQERIRELWEIDRKFNELVAKWNSNDAY